MRTYNPIYLVSLTALSLSMGAALSFIDVTEALPDSFTSSIDSVGRMPSLELQSSKLGSLNSTPQVQDSLGQGLKVPKSLEIEVQKGDTIGKILADNGANEELISFVQTDKTAKALSNLYPGQSLLIKVSAGGEIDSLEYKKKVSQTDTHKEMIRVASIGPNRFKSEIIKTDFLKKEVLTTGEIDSSLFGATSQAGLSDKLALEMTQVFSGVIDFHRELQPGDNFKVVYEQYYLGNKPMTQGSLKYVEFTNNGKTHKAYKYKTLLGSSYYNEKGESLKKSFLRSPLKFSRISSGFTLARFHPIANTWRAHKGVDYAAPTGTPIMATADGVVKYKGDMGGYGNVVILNHGAGRETLYAHLSKFGSISVGQKISQEKVIGYVGSTGWSTGPHLHYEYKLNGNAINPLSVKTPMSQSLEGKDKEAFGRLKKEIDKKIATPQYEV